MVRVVRATDVILVTRVIRIIGVRSIATVVKVLSLD
jgi:hypothetical protein